MWQDPKQLKPKASSTSEAPLCRSGAFICVVSNVQRLGIKETLKSCHKYVSFNCVTLVNDPLASKSSLTCNLLLRRSRSCSKGKKKKAFLSTPRERKQILLGGVYSWSCFVVVILLLWFFFRFSCLYKNSFYFMPFVFLTSILCNRFPFVLVAFSLLECLCVQ